MEFFLFYPMFAIAAGIFASSRGRSGFGWFLISLLISPLLSFIFLLVLQNLKEKSMMPNSDTHVKCPDCSELVLKEARVCKHCRCKLIPQFKFYN